MDFIIGAFSNAIRGGQWREWLGVKAEWLPSDAINATIYACYVLATTANPMLAAMSFVAMWVGAAPGWGDYIGSLGGWRFNDLKESPLIDCIIKPIRRWPKLWGWAGLSMRGLFWGSCLAILFAIYGLPWHSFLIAGASMPLWYWLAIKWAKHRAPENWQSAGWALSEVMFGAVLWSALP